MDNEAATKHCKELLKGYLKKYYGYEDMLMDQMSHMGEKEITKFILIQGHLERFAKEHNVTPRSRTTPAPLKKDKIVTNQYEITYVIQCSKKRSGGAAAAEIIDKVYATLHPIIIIITSFDCNFGLVPISTTSRKPTLCSIKDVEDINVAVKDTYTGLVVRKKYEDTLSFNFKITTEVDMVHFLNKPYDYNVSTGKTLAKYFKEKKIHLEIIWKELPKQTKIALIGNSTANDDREKCLKELCKWLTLGKIQANPNQLSIEWETRASSSGTRARIAVLRVHPSIADKVKEALQDFEDPITYTYLVDFAYTCFFNPSRLFTSR